MLGSKCRSLASSHLMSAISQGSREQAAQLMGTYSLFNNAVVHKKTNKQTKTHTVQDDLIKEPQHWPHATEKP